MCLPEISAMSEIPTRILGILRYSQVILCVVPPSLAPSGLWKRVIFFWLADLWACPLGLLAHMVPEVPLLVVRVKSNRWQEIHLGDWYYLSMYIYIYVCMSNIYIYITYIIIYIYELWGSSNASLFFHQYSRLLQENGRFWDDLGSCPAPSAGPGTPRTTPSSIPLEGAPVSFCWVEHGQTISTFLAYFLYH